MLQDQSRNRTPMPGAQAPEVTPPDTGPARAEAGIATMLAATAPEPDHVPQAPSDLADACDWVIRHVAWMNRTGGSEDWSDLRLDAEMDKSDAVWKRAIVEPTADLGCVAAKSRMLLSDLEAQRVEFPEIPQDDRDRLVVAVLRDVAALSPPAAPPTELPAPGSPEALAAFSAACRVVDASSGSEAECAALKIGGSVLQYWTSEVVEQAQMGNFSRVSPGAVEAAKATSKARLEELLILALRRELRMAEAAKSSRIRELHALVYGDEPDPDDGSEAPAPSEPDPIFVLIEARAQTQTAFDTWGEHNASPLTDDMHAEEDALSAASLSAYERMISTAPTTAAGRLALLDRLRVEMDLHGMANGDPPHEGHHFWPDFFGALRGALSGPTAAPATALKPASADPHLVAMVAEWQGERRRLDNPSSEGMSDDELNALSDQNSTRQIEIYLYPARTPLDLLAKVPVLRDELRDAMRGCKDQLPTATLAGAAWTGLLADIERIAGTSCALAPAHDAELIALVEPWEAAHQLYEQRTEEQAEVERIAEASDSYPGPSPEGLGADFKEWRNRADEYREQTGINDAETASADALHDLCEIEDQIAALPARTMAGLRLKARVAERYSSIDVEWPDGLGDGLVRDLLAATAPPLAASPVADQIIASWRESAHHMVGGLQSTPATEEEGEHLDERQHDALTLADELPATIDNLLPKALALAAIEATELLQRDKPRADYAMDGRLAFDLHAAITGTAPGNAS